MNFLRGNGKSEDSRNLIYKENFGDEDENSSRKKYGSVDELNHGITPKITPNEKLQGYGDGSANESKETAGTSSALRKRLQKMSEQSSPTKSCSTDTATTSTNSIQTVSSSSKVSGLAKAFKLHPFLSQSVVYSALPFLVWVVLYLVVGHDNLPGGTIFLLVLLECGGRLLGYLVSLIHLPPMVGMLGLGIALRNIPLGLMSNYNPAVSAPIRQIALAVILTRAGFGLDLNTLIKFKWLVLRLAFFPTVLEALSVGLVTHFILGFPWVWGILVGFVVAAVSPAVIVPRILEFKSQGYGEEKGIPTVILAAASLDNVVAISFFGVALSFIFSADRGIVAMISQCPLEVIAGFGFGFVWGFIIAFIFNPSSTKNPKMEVDADESFVKGSFVLGGGIISIFGFKLINYSGAGALGCIMSAFVTVTVWKTRGFSELEINQIKWGFTFLWKFFEPLLFGVIGCQMVLSELNGRAVGLSVAALLIGAAVRFIVTYSAVSVSNYTVKEKLFAAIAWVPKATVQAAIGPTALDYARNDETSDAPELQRLATDVLTIAVVVILLTAPIGEFAVMMTGPRFLSKATDKQDSQDRPVPQDKDKDENSCPV